MGGRCSEVPDPCLGWLPFTGYACCGHGLRGRAYIVSDLGHWGGPAAAWKLRELGGNPPAAAFLLDPVLGATE